MACCVMTAMKSLAVLLLQVVALLVINEAGYAVVSVLHLPVPGNLLGMLFLLALLVTGVLPLRWIDASASLLIRHLAFFFIPIAVGLMAFAELFLDNGPAILPIEMRSTPPPQQCARDSIQSCSPARGCAVL